MKKLFLFTVNDSLNSSERRFIKGTIYASQEPYDLNRPR